MYSALCNGWPHIKVRSVLKNNCMRAETINLNALPTLIASDQNPTVQQTCVFGIQPQTLSH